MNRKKKILSLVVVIALLFVLTSCGDITKEISNENAKWHDYILLFPIAWIMQLIAGVFNNSFGWGIVFTTILIRGLAWPIYSKTNDFSMKMAIMQPEMQRIQNKYANRDDQESKQRMQMEMAHLYKKYKFSPFGCLMPFLQMPIFIGVYQAVQRIWIPGGKWAHKVSNMSFLTIDLSSKGNLQAILGKGGDWKGWILSIIVLLTNLTLTLISTKKPSYMKETHTHKQDGQMEGQQGAMKIMQYVMVFMMFTIALGSNSLALYWVVGNTFSIIQTLISRKLNEIKYNKMRYEDLVVKSRD